MLMASGNHSSMNSGANKSCVRRDDQSPYRVVIDNPFDRTGKQPANYEAKSGQSDRKR
jgi:hypothetical protein